MNRVLRRFNMDKIVPQMMNRRRNNRNRLWLSLLGIGLAGGATYFMSRNNNGGLRKIMKQMVNSMNLPGLNQLNTN